MKGPLVIEGVGDLIEGMPHVSAIAVTRMPTSRSVVPSQLQRQRAEGLLVAAWARTVIAAAAAEWFQGPGRRGRVVLPDEEGKTAYRVPDGLTAEPVDTGGLT